jgi:hypothetical protein
VLDTIQTLWIGDKLSTMEQLCLSSFVKNGHETHLYTYSDVKNVPSGVIIKDGNEILPENMIFSYKKGAGKGSFSAFSIYFRYKLVHDKGGYWVDTDQVCLKPFDFEDAFVFSSEEVFPMNQGNMHVNAGVIKAPRGSPVAKYAFDFCVQRNKDELVWGQIGPKLVKRCVENFGLNSFVKEPSVFCPIPGAYWNILINPVTEIKIPESVYGIHLWNEMWRRDQADKDHKYDPKCLYEQLKKKFL